MFAIIVDGVATAASIVMRATRGGWSLLVDRRSLTACMGLKRISRTGGETCCWRSVAIAPEMERQDMVI